MESNKCYQLSEDEVEKISEELMETILEMIGQNEQSGQLTREAMIDRILKKIKGRLECSLKR